MPALQTEDRNGSDDDESPARKIRHNPGRTRTAMHNGPDDRFVSVPAPDDPRGPLVLQLGLTTETSVPRIGNPAEPGRRPPKLHPQASRWESRVLSPASVCRRERQVSHR